MSLIQKLLAFLGVTAGTPSVASATKLFDKALSKLQQVEQSQEAEAVRHAAQIVESQAAHEAAAIEAANARAVAAALPPALAQKAEGDKPFEALYQITGQQGADLGEKLVQALSRP